MSNYNNTKIPRTIFDNNKLNTKITNRFLYDIKVAINSISDESAQVNVCQACESECSQCSQICQSCQGQCTQCTNDCQQCQSCQAQCR